MTYLSSEKMCFSSLNKNITFINDSDYGDISRIQAVVRINIVKLKTKDFFLIVNCNWVDRNFSKVTINNGAIALS